MTHYRKAAIGYFKTKNRLPLYSFDQYSYQARTLQGKFSQFRNTPCSRGFQWGMSCSATSSRFSYKKTYWLI